MHRIFKFVGHVAPFTIFENLKERLNDGFSKRQANDSTTVGGYIDWSRGILLRVMRMYVHLMEKE